jgi:hypothetical protein
MFCGLAGLWEMFSVIRNNTQNTAELIFQPRKNTASIALKEFMKDAFFQIWKVVFGE